MVRLSRLRAGAATTGRTALLHRPADGSRPANGAQRFDGVLPLLDFALELVEDRGNKTPFDAGLKLAAKVKAAALEAGLICYPSSGTIDGRLGDHILLAPPYIFNKSHVDELVSKLSSALTTALPGS